MEVAEYLANCVNMEAITKVVLMKPDDTPLNNEDLSQMREDKVQTFIKDYHAEVAVHAKAESGLQYEARLYLRGRRGHRHGHEQVRPGARP